MLRPQIDRYLEVHGVPYRLLRREDEERTPNASPAGDVQESDQAVRVSLTKGVLVELDSGDEVICVIPASSEVDLDALCDLLQAGDAVVCETGRILDLFPGCELGTAPPFAGLWNIPVILDAEVEDADRILMPAGNHEELLEIRTRDFLALEEPLAASISSLPGEPWMHAVPVGSYLPPTLTR